MKAILHVLIKSLVVPFYRSHAGLLAFVFIIMFGVVESSQVISYHQSLIYGMLTSGIFLTAVMVIWTLYQLKVLHFLLKTSGENSYQFLTYLTALPKGESMGYFLVICFLNFLPVFFYSIAIYALGIQNKFFGTTGIIFASQIALLISNAAVLNYVIRNKHIASRFSLPSITMPFQDSQVGMYAGYLFKEEKLAVLLSKIFSLSLIYLVKETLEEGDDFRIIGITWLFALLSHTFLIEKLKSFEDRSLMWMKCLPIDTNKKFFTYFVVYGVLMLPELLLLTNHIGRGIAYFQLPLLLVLSSGFLLSIHSYLYKPGRNPDSFITYLFWLFIGCFMVVLSQLIWLLTLILLIRSYLLIKKRYFQYEPMLN